MMSMACQLLSPTVRTAPDRARIPTEVDVRSGVLKARSCSIDPRAGQALEHTWANAMEQIWLPAPEPRDRDGFFGSVSTIVSPQGIEFSHLCSSAQTISGRCSEAPTSLWVALLIEGAFSWGDDADGVELCAGDLLYGPTGRASTLVVRGDFRMLYITVPQRLLHPRLLNLRSLEVGTLSGRSSVNRAFAGMLRVIADDLENLTVEEIRPIEVALSEFLIASLWEEAGTPTLGRARAEHFHQICQDIELRLGDCELSLGKVAQANHVSSRYIQKLFGEAGFSFSHYLRLRRLEHCRADLSSRAHATLSISEICFRWGFNDAAHFSRSFRNQYQTTPREYRQRYLGERARPEAGGVRARERERQALAA